MIHQEILKIIKKDREQNGYIFPYYGRFSIAEIGPTILKRFGVQTNRQTFPDNFLPQKTSESEKVVLFMVDGFGLEYFEKHYKEMDFYNRLVNKGEVNPITSVFPSTTSAALTTIHTGLTPQEHGLPEWTVYFEEVDRIIQTIPFTYAPAQKRDSVMEIGGMPEMLYEGDTVYEKLNHAGIKVFSFMPLDTLEGSYTRMTKKGSELNGYANGTDLMVKLKQKLESHEGPGYFFVYWTQVDSVQHHFGLGSSEHIQQLNDFSFLASRFVDEVNLDKSGEVLVLMVADHGQRDIVGDKIIYLNDYIRLQENYSKSKSGAIILPSGSPHDVFIFVSPDKLIQTKDYLKEQLLGKAVVLTIDEAVKKGLFGLNDASVRFLRRVGNLLIIPNSENHVWYRFSPEDRYHFKGMHGGASEREMIVPFASARLSDLVK